MTERSRKHPVQFYLNDDEQFILDEKFRLSKMKSKSAFLRKLNQHNKFHLQKRYGRYKGADESDMAVTKIHGIKATIGQAIEYICNPAKRDENIYTSSFACAPETAALDFKYTLDHATDYSSINGKNNENKAFHLIQAFEPGEVSYNTAHAIGKELADKLLKGKYSYVLTTHIDRDHVHNHIIFCAADIINHNHYHDCKKSYWHIRNLSDQLCQEYGLSVIQPSGKRGKKYNEWNARQNGQSIKVQIRKDINQFIKLSSSYEEKASKIKAHAITLAYRAMVV